ncbi:hypothetical protein EDB80DRAFT_691778 [Ilyonectria destructans]|nr:hypothetical protein EDB80DRAFT_691778 [Ilyonectria destructans]
MSLGLVGKPERGDNTRQMFSSSKKNQDKPGSLFSFNNPEHGNTMSKPSGILSTPLNVFGNPVSGDKVTKHSKICTCSSGLEDHVGFGKSDENKAGPDFPFGNSERGDKMAEPSSLDLSSNRRHNTKPLFGVSTDRQEDTSAFLDPHGRTYGGGLFGPKPEVREPTKSLFNVDKTPQNPFPTIFNVDETPQNPFPTIFNVDNTPQDPFPPISGPQSRTSGTGLFGLKPECKNNTKSSLNSNTMPQKNTVRFGNTPKDRNSKAGVFQFPGKRNDHVTGLFNSRSECRDDTKLALGVNSLPQKHTGRFENTPQDRNNNAQVSNLSEKRKRHVHWSSNTESECRDDTGPLLSPKTKSQKLTPKHGSTNREDKASDMDEDTWSVEHVAPEEMEVNCPGGYKFHLQVPKHWGKDIITSTSATKMTIANRTEARSWMSEGFNPRYLLDPDYSSTLGQKEVYVSATGHIWKIDFVICEDKSIQFGYYKAFLAGASEVGAFLPI